jgi:UDP-glucose 4-epimerase
MNEKILVTGGSGYIGSFTVLALLQARYDVVVVDNLSNSSVESLNRVQKIAGRKLLFIEGDVCDRHTLDTVFAQHGINAVIHFAGLKSIGESVANPLRYYANNVHGSQVLLQSMTHAGIFNIVFSSSATVYGDPAVVPVDESCCLGPQSPYGRTKLMVEDMLRDLATTDSRWRIAILRYFNPVGAHETGLIGEDPRAIPNNLLPFIAQVAVGKLPRLFVFGNDYPTADGTGVRDYIHVLDLAEGHLRALEALRSLTGYHIWNLGAGQGYSVFEMVRAFEQVSGRQVPYQIAPRRAGDIAKCYANVTKAAVEIGWRAKRGLPEIMRDTWRWQSMNPRGYC